MAREPHPQKELEALERGLAQGLAAGYVLRGAEHWFVARALEAIRARANAAGLEACAHDRADPAFDLARLLDDLRGGALFASGRLVVATGIDEHLKKSGAEESAAARAIRAFVDGRRGSVVVVSEALRADHAVVRAIQAAGGSLHTFRALWDTAPAWDPDPAATELAQWIAARARALGLKLTRDSLLLLARARGNDLAALDSEIIALRSAGPAAAGRLASDAAGSPQRLADALLAGEARAALLEIEELWRSGFARGSGSGRESGAGAILAVLCANLRRGLRQALCGALALEAGSDLEGAAEQAGVPSWPRARQAFRSHVGVRDARAWRAMQADLLVLERRSRSGASVDAGDLAAFALRWRKAGARAPAGAPARGGPA